MLCHLEEKIGISVHHDSSLFHGGQLIQNQEGKELISDFPSIVNGSTLFLVFRHFGIEEYEVIPDAEVPDALAELSDEPDMITFDTNPHVKRVKMPCGHVIGPQMLTEYCHSQLKVGFCVLILIVLHSNVVTENGLIPKCDVLEY